MPTTTTTTTTTNTEGGVTTTTTTTTTTTADAASPYGVAFLEVPIQEGKLEEAVQLLTDHPHGLSYTSAQPGFISLSLAADTKANSVILMEKWEKADDWVTYEATRHVEEGELGESNAAWNAAIGPLVGGAPRMSPMECRKHYDGSISAAAGASYGVAALEIPIQEGKLEEAVQLLTDHPHGLSYTSAQPGFISLSLAADTKANSVILMEKWEKADDWVTYEATRHVEEGELGESNAAWNAAIGPLVGGAPRMSPMKCRKHYGK